MQLAMLPVGNITFLDGTGNSGVTRLYLPSGTLVGTALASLEGTAGVVIPITGCVPVRLSVTYTVKVMPPLGTSGAAPARNVGLFVFNTSDVDVFSVVGVPGILASLLSTTGPFAGINIDLDNGTVSSFTDNVRDGIYTDPFGLDLSGVSSAYFREET